MTWLKFKHGTLKTIQCDNNFEPPHSVLSPLNSNIITKESKPMGVTFDLPSDLNGSSPMCEIHNSRNVTQVSLYFYDLLSYFHLFTRAKKGKNHCN